MLWYKIALDRKVPTTWLTYSSETRLEIGRLVEVSVRKSSCVGVVLEEVPRPAIKTKQVAKTLPIILPAKYIRFLHLFCYNTLNDYNNVLAIITSWLQKLTKKQMQELVHSESDNRTLSAPRQLEVPKITNTKDIDYYVEKEQWLRIKIIIRSSIDLQRSDRGSQSNTIVLFVPEKNYQEYYQKLIEKEFGTDISIMLFSGDANSQTRSVFAQLCNRLHKNDASPTLIITTRAGVFLPLKEIQTVIVTDESSHLYIQEQNGVYFDTRDAAYLLAQVFHAKLIFTSTLPSIRRFYFDSETVLNGLSSNYLESRQKFPKIKIYTRERKDTFFGIFSSSILEDIGVKLLDD